MPALTPLSVSAKQKKALPTPIAVSDGVSVTVVESNYAYFNDDGFTMYYKQGLTITVPYDAQTKLALKAFEDAAFAALNAIPAIP